MIMSWLLKYQCGSDNARGVTGRWRAVDEGECRAQRCHRVYDTSISDQLTYHHKGRGIARQDLNDTSIGSSPGHPAVSLARNIAHQGLGKFRSGTTLGLQLATSPLG